MAQPQFSRIEIEAPRLRCGAGAKLKTVAVEAKRAGLQGPTESSTPDGGEKAEDRPVVQTARRTHADTPDKATRPGDQEQMCRQEQ